MAGGATSTTARGALALLVLACGCATAARSAAPTRATTPAKTPATTQSLPPVPAVPDALEGTVEQLRKDAAALMPQMRTSTGREFLASVDALVHVAPHAVFRSADKTRWYTAGQAAALPAGDRAALTSITVDEPLYYETKYGSPLAYARAFDVLGLHGFGLHGGRSADFGYGGIGPLRMLASLGYQATGVDVDPMLPALYGPAGVWTADPGGRGAFRILDGRFPLDAGIVQAIGSGLDLFVAKNTLKKGYIHPDRPADPRRLIDLGVSDAQFLAALHDALAPGGWFLLYNICPALTPPDEPFVPWSDGRSPFSRQELEAAGFEVLEIDRDDTPAIRRLGHTLRWDVGEDAMDLEKDLSVLYTLARRR